MALKYNLDSRIFKNIIKKALNTFYESFFFLKIKFLYNNFIYLLKYLLIHYYNFTYG